MCNSFRNNYGLVPRKLSQNKQKEAINLLQGKPEVIQERICQRNILCGSLVYHDILNHDNAEYGLNQKLWYDYTGRMKALEVCLWSECKKFKINEICIF